MMTESASKLFNVVMAIVFWNFVAGCLSVN
jgi:hypothetical protein